HLEIGMPRLEITHDILQRCADKEILLLEPENSPGRNAVVRIENFGNRLRFGLVADCCEVIALIELIEIEFVRCLRAPEPQTVDGIVEISGDGNIVRNGKDILRLRPVVLQMTAHIVRGMYRAVKLHPERK